MGHRRVIVFSIVTALLLVFAAPAVADPADGNGNKQVIDLDRTSTVVCPDGNTLDVRADGWFQTRESKNNKKNLALEVYSLKLTYTNENGDTWRYVDVGPNRFFLIDGVPHIAITGRPGSVPNPNDPGGATSLSGTTWINLDTGDIVRFAGNAPGTDVDEQACAALT